MVARSYLFVPGDKEKMLVKSIGCGADALVWDLEDAVPADQKEIARKTIRRQLEALPRHSPQVWVRINPIGTGQLEDDLEAVVQRGLRGVMLAKTESAEQVDQLARSLEAREKSAGLNPGSVKVQAILETAAGVCLAREISGASKRLAGLSLGAEDFTLDLGTSRSREGIELAYARGAIVLAAAYARIEAVDTVFSDLSDLEGLAQESRLARQMGFRGKYAIHPRQVPVINETFSPTEAELAFARKVVQAFAEVQNQAGVITVDGKMIDAPIVERARRLLQG